MHKSFNIIFNGGIHGVCKCTMNIYSSLMFTSNREHSEIKTIVMFSTSAIHVTCKYISVISFNLLSKVNNWSITVFVNYKPPLPKKKNQKKTREFIRMHCLCRKDQVNMSWTSFKSCYMWFQLISSSCVNVTGWKLKVSFVYNVDEPNKIFWTISNVSLSIKFFGSSPLFSSNETWTMQISSGSENKLNIINLTKFDNVAVFILCLNTHLTINQFYFIRFN